MLFAYRAQTLIQTHKQTVRQTEPTAISTHHSAGLNDKSVSYPKEI